LLFILFINFLTLLGTIVCIKILFKFKDNKKQTLEFIYVFNLFLQNQLKSDRIISGFCAIFFSFSINLQETSIGGGVCGCLQWGGVRVY